MVEIFCCVLQARVENKKKRSEIEAQADRSHKKRKESHHAWRPAAQDRAGAGGDERRISLSHVGEKAEIEFLPKERAREHRRTRHDSESSEEYGRGIQRPARSNASATLSRNERFYLEEGRGKVGLHRRRGECDGMKEARRKGSSDSERSDRDKWKRISMHSEDHILYTRRGKEEGLDSVHRSAWEARRDALKSGKSSAEKGRSGGRVVRQKDSEGSMEDAERISRDANVRSRTSFLHENSRRDASRDEQTRGD